MEGRKSLFKWGVRARLVTAGLLVVGGSLGWAAVGNSQNTSCWPLNACLTHHTDSSACGDNANACGFKLIDIPRGSVVGWVDGGWGPDRLVACVRRQVPEGAPNDVRYIDDWSGGLTDWVKGDVVLAPDGKITEDYAICSGGGGETRMFATEDIQCGSGWEEVTIQPLVDWQNHIFSASHLSGNSSLQLTMPGGYGAAVCGSSGPEDFSVFGAQAVLSGGGENDLLRADYPNSFLEGGAGEDTFGGGGVAMCVGGPDTDKGCNTCGSAVSCELP